MDPREVDALVQRLIANPHDQEALAYAHQAGASDPRSYATLLERVGRETPDPAYASHWLSESANVWSTTLGDAHHAAEVLLLAVVKDPTQDLAADRLAQLYREKGDTKGLAALLEKRVKMLAPLASQDPQWIAKLAAMHEELGTLWAEPPLAQPNRALENFKRAYETDPQSVFAIYSAREILKSMQQWADAIPLFAMEQALVTDPERKLALYRDEADTRRQARDLAGAADALRNMRAYAPEDPSLWQEIASTILERIRAGEGVTAEERDEGAALFVALAETYDGEHGLAYSAAALDIVPGNDRAVQLATHYAMQLGRDAELPPMWQAYMAANPNGAMAADIEARMAAAGVSAARGPSARPPLEPARQEAPAIHSAPAPAQEPQQPEPSGQFEHRPAEPPSPERLAQLLDQAQQYATKRQAKEALQTYMEVLHLDPVSPEALAWVDEHLRSKRKFAELRDVYQAASRAPSIGPDVRKKFLSNVANICEQQLRDLDGAIQALKQASQIDPSVRDNLRRLLEKGQRWDDLAVLLDQEVMDAPDQEAQIGLLKKLAALHEQKRKDLVAAGEAWSRLATLMLGDENPITAAVKLFEKGNRFDLAAEVISDNVGAIDSADTRLTLQMRLGELREKTGDQGAAGEAYAEAADLGGGAKAWELAEKCWEKAERWEDAAHATGEMANLAGEPRQQAALHAREAELLVRAGDQASAILRLEQAADLDPSNDEYASALEARYQEADRPDDLVQFLLRRAAKLTDASKRKALRRRAADMQREKLSDMDAARETLLLVLEDGDDAETLTLLSDDARERAEYQEEATLLHRLAAVTSDATARAQIMLREAGVLATDLNDVDAAVAAYEAVLESLDANNVEALAALADLEERRENYKQAASALERHLKLVGTAEDKIAIARRLAEMYQDRLDDKRGAIQALEVVHASDADDFDAISRLVELCESVEDWERTAQLLAKLLEVEGDPSEASSLARRLAEIMEERLGRGQDSLAVLESLADEGDEQCRTAYVEIGDRLNFKGIVAMKLRDWYALAPASKQHEAFQGAFERFVEMGRDSDASQIAVELIRARGATPEIVKKLEEIASRNKDLDSLGAAHDTMARELSGVERAEEYVRQAEVLVQAGVAPGEAVTHGEQGLTSVPPNEVEPLLERLAQLLGDTAAIVDLYERQVGRCKAPNDRLAALARAAQVAAERGALDRVKAMFELALGGGVRDDTIEMLEKAAADGDAERSSTDLRSALAHAMAAGSSGLRDGGRTRASMLRRAATIAHRELNDTDKAFAWMGEALVTHVEPSTLDALEGLADEVGDVKRAEDVIGKALEQVFDGPLVRQLVGRRATLRRTKLGDLRGAADDLKRLHDLSPSDKSITDDLYDLLKQLRDFRGMVQLLEDQILRGKDPAQRAELARKAARLWEERLADPREAADAWRRVLRMKPGDPEAQSGLERAKTNMLKPPESLLPPGPDDLEPQAEIPPAARAPSPPAADESASPSGPPTEPPVRDTVPPMPEQAAEPMGEQPQPTSEAPAAPGGEPPAGAPVHQRPARPDISFRRGGDEEPTLSTPVAALPHQPVEIVPAATDEFPAAGTLGSGNTTQPEYIDDLDDDVESVDDDELLDMEPVDEPDQPPPRK